MATLTVTAGTPKTVTFTTLTQTVAQGSEASYNITTTGIANASFAGNATWYSTSAGTGTPVSAPEGLWQPGFSVSGNSATKIIRTNYNGATTPSGTYWFRINIDGVQSSNVATLIVTDPDPTSISFANANIYTWHGKANDLGMTVSPSNADRSKITWTQSPSINFISATDIVSTGTGNAVAMVSNTGQGAGANAGHGCSVTLTAKLPNGNTASVTLKAKFSMRAYTAINPFSKEDWFNWGLSYSWDRIFTTRYVRAYYGANETQWAYANNVVHESSGLAKISTDDYTITSSSPDITVTKNADGVTYNLTRSSASGLRAVTLYITTGILTYAQVINLVD